MLMGCLGSCVMEGKGIPFAVYAPINYYIGVSLWASGATVRQLHNGTCVLSLPWRDFRLVLSLWLFFHEAWQNWPLEHAGGGVK